MKPFEKLITRIEALQIISNNIEKIQLTEIIDLDNASKRVLAELVIANFDVPPFDRSSMDGYAVNAEDTFEAGKFKPIKLELVGIQHAGEVFEGEVKNGECVEIATGCSLPKGTNAVVMVEYTKVIDDYVEIQKPVYPGANIAKAGEDIKKSEKIFEKGTYLTPARIGAIAALGIETVNVFTKPRIAVYSTGPEIVPQGQPLKPGQIYDVNSYTLKSVIESNGCIAVRSGIVKDRRDNLEESLDEAVNYDMSVFSGGSSVGTRDLFSTVFDEKGTILFHGVLVKPGKPTLFGKIRGTPIFGMPGYPTSCLSNAYAFLIPALRKMARLPEWRPKTVYAKLSERVVSTSGREQFLTVKIEDDFVYPVYKQSGDITSIANADGYIILPVNQDTIEEGEEVTVHLYP